MAKKNDISAYRKAANTIVATFGKKKVTKVTNVVPQNVALKAAKRVVEGVSISKVISELSKTYKTEKPLSGVKRIKKSKACSMVLKLMDNDYSYSEALKTVLSENKKLDRKSLEKELKNYI